MVAQYTLEVGLLFVRQAILLCRFFNVRNGLADVFVLFLFDRIQQCRVPGWVFLGAGLVLVNPRKIVGGARFVVALPVEARGHKPPEMAHE